MAPPRPCPSLTAEGLQLTSSTTATRIGLPGVACSERYVSEVSCGNQSFVFTRRNLGDSREFDTVVRTARRAQPSRGGAADDRFAYSRPQQGLAKGLLMSHNAVVVCEGGQLVAYGGMAHPPKHLGHLPEAGEDWLGDDVGITRSVAVPVLPLRWSPPQLVVSGSKKGTGCMHVLNGPGDCEYDGKVSAVRFGGRLLLFTRSNLHGSGGARHVQVTCSTDGVSGWSRFRQVSIAGVTTGASANNIYFFSVQRVTWRDDDALLAAFPAVLDKLGSGIFLSMSRDGTNWSRPVPYPRTPTAAPPSARHAPCTQALQSAGGGGRVVAGELRAWLSGAPPIAVAGAGSAL